MTPPPRAALIQEAREFITAANGQTPCECYDPDTKEDVARWEDPLCAGCHFPKADHVIARLLALVDLPQQTPTLRANRFDCRECGRGIAVDEDGCCRTCGADAEAVGEAPQGAVTTLDDSRCAVCGWPLRERVQDGCTRGNCSMRPLPTLFYDRSRAVAEYGPFAGRLQHTNAPAAAVPPSPWKPIEEAPKGSGKDGPQYVRHPDYVQPPHLWLLLPDGQRCVGSFDWYYAEGGNGYDGESAWVEEFSGERVRPTHWQPLPDPPSGSVRT